jgi:hypothetical protein
MIRPILSRIFTTKQVFAVLDDATSAAETTGLADDDTRND